MMPQINPWDTAPGKALKKLARFAILFSLLPPRRGFSSLGAAYAFYSKKGRKEISFLPFAGPFQVPGQAMGS